MFPWRVVTWCLLSLVGPLIASFQTIACLYSSLADCNIIPTSLLLFFFCLLLEQKTFLLPHKYHKSQFSFTETAFNALTGTNFYNKINSFSSTVK